MVGSPGLEPGTIRLWAGCSNQLSYEPASWSKAVIIAMQSLFNAKFWFKNAKMYNTPNLIQGERWTKI